MYFYASLFAALVITILVVSKIAKMLLAKRHSFAWVLTASLIGGLVAVVAYVLLSMFVHGIDPTVMLIASLSTMFIVSSAAFKFINKMSWSGAITTNIANIVVILITVTAAVVLNGKSLEHEFAALNLKANDQMLIVESAASHHDEMVEVIDDEQGMESGLGLDDISDDFLPEPVVADNEFTDEEEEPQITERDLLPPSSAKELEKKEKVVYIEPKYRTIGVSSIGSLVGQTIRVLKSNGNTVSGALKSVKGSDIYLVQRISNGFATTPIAIAKIRKLEVYR